MCSDATSGSALGFISSSGGGPYWEQGIKPSLDMYKANILPAAYFSGCHLNFFFMRTECMLDQCHTEKKGDISELAGLGSLFSLPRPPPLLSFIRDILCICAEATVSWEKNDTLLLLGKGADFPGMLCVLNPFTN